MTYTEHKLNALELLKEVDILLSEPSNENKRRILSNLRDSLDLQVSCLESIEQLLERGQYD